MADLVKIFFNANSLKKATNHMTIKELEGVKGRLEKVIERRRREEERLATARQEKAAQIARIREMMELEGISVKELGKIALGRKRTGVLPPKYELTTEEGGRVTWSGRGRMPKALRARLDAGKKLESFLIHS